MKYLVDTNVLSEATKPMPEATVIAWLRDHETEIAVDPIILGELRFGILLLPNSRRRQRLEEWFQFLEHSLLCLPWEAQTAGCWAELLAQLRKTGQAMPIKDSLIAATAIRHNLIIATRNSPDFTRNGIKTFNPFAA